jgi:hypothetical protein
MARTFTNNNKWLASGNAPVAGLPLTVAIWFKTAASDYGNTPMFSIGNSTTGYGVTALVTFADKIRYNLVDSGGGLNIDTTASQTAQAWQHACVVSGGANDHRVYLNGANKIVDSTAKSPSGLTNTTIGSNVPHDVDFVGSLAEFAVWNAALTDAEVALLGLGLSPLLVRPQSIQVYVPVFGTYSPEIDLCGRAPMTIQGTVPLADSPRIVRPIGPIVVLSGEAAKPAVCWGYAAPDADEVARSWSVWQVEGGGAVTVTGDPDYGSISIDVGDAVVSDVVDTGDATLKYFILTKDKYGAGSDVSISIRGSDTPFNALDASPSWTSYDMEYVQAAWRYVQVKLAHG